MNVLKKGILCIAYITASSVAFTQNQYSPFKGSIHVGSGICTIADFKMDNNSGTTPIQIGLKTHKYINSEDFIEFGLLYTKKGVRNAIFYSVPGGGSGQNVHKIDLNNIEIPIIFYSANSIFSKLNTVHFFGISNCYAIKTPIVDVGDPILIDENIYRKYNFSAIAGIGISIKQNIRIDLFIDGSFLSVVRSEYRVDFEEIVDYYGSRLYPVEAILSVNYIFK